MKKIEIKESDGSDPLPICRSHREELIERFKDIEMILLQFFEFNKNSSRALSAPSKKSIEHIHKCKRCHQWLHAVSPDHTLRRQSRLSKYCCASMYCAVEEYEDRKSSKISFTLFRGEDPCWRISDDYSFLIYCPWCGKELPDKPFT